MTDAERARVAEIRNLKITIDGTWGGTFSKSAVEYVASRLSGAIQELASIIDRLAEGPEVVHARWEPDNIDGCCTACGDGKPCDGYGDCYESDYCPRCGAKMDGQRAGEVTNRAAD